MPPLAHATVRVLRATLCVLLLGPAAAGAAGIEWARPVDGVVAREFAAGRFVPSAHRGADLAARPGTAVRAACGGRVTFAGRTPAGGVVSVGCGRWRVTHLPVDPLVTAGDRVAAGEQVGRLRAGHGGLHLGVRRALDPHGYVDPLRFLPPPAAPAGPPPVAWTRYRRPSDVRPFQPRLRGFPASRLESRTSVETRHGRPSTIVVAGAALVFAASTAGAVTALRRRKRREGPRQAPLVSYP